MPKSRKSSNVEDNQEDQLVLRLIAALNDSAVLNKMKQVLFPDELAKEIRELRQTFKNFQQQLDEKNNKITLLEDKVIHLQNQIDDNEQYGRRANLRFSGIDETGHGEDLESKLIEICNEHMKISPAVLPSDFERVHRIGRKTDTSTRPRPVIVRFKSEKTRDRVFQSRASLKQKNERVAERSLKIFINEDLTTMRAKLAYETRVLKKANKIRDCWTYNGNIVIKDVNNVIHRIYTSNELDKYQ